MAQIIREPDFGTSFGEAFGSGLQQAFSLLAQKKLQQLARQEQARGLQALGYSPEQSLQLASLDPSILREVIKQQSKEAETARFGQALSMLAGGGQPANLEQQLLQVLQQPTATKQAQAVSPQLGVQQPKMPFADLAQFESPQAKLQKLIESSTGIKPIPGVPSVAGAVANLPQFLAGLPAKPEAIAPIVQVMPKSESAKQLLQQTPQLRTIKPSDVAAIARQTKLSPQQYKDLNQIAQANQKMELSERKQQFLESREARKAERETAKEARMAQEAVNKETKVYYDRVLEEDKVAKEADQTLKKMQKLVEKGKLPPAGLYNFVSRLEEDISPAAAGLLGGGVGTAVGGPFGAVVGGLSGLVISPLASLLKTGLNYKYPDAEEFTKLSNSFIRGAKAVFGNRITDSDLKAWLATVPTLGQTDNGKKQIIKNMEIFNKATHARAQAMKKILKENKGKRPENLPILVEEVAQNELDKLANEFVTA